jgi:Flp pilus assembly protein TadG
MVEFALVGGLFFFLIFSITNAGFFLYGRAAIEHAADVGTATIAAEGQCMAAGGMCVSLPSSCSMPSSNADEVAICRMDQAGLTTTALITITQIVVWKEHENSNGTFTDDTTGCAGGPCKDVYDVNGVGTVPWPPSARTVNGVNGPDFAKLVITFHYSLLATSGGFTMSTYNIFRLEPQE